MGRPERPLDPESGPVRRLAYELRALRRDAGTPSYRAMAKCAGYAPTTLSQAAAGERLPSLGVVLGYVRACGGDTEEWEARWKDADAEVAGAPAEVDGCSPYRGLARFEPADRALFFGRDRLLCEVRELVCARRLAVLSGPSGSGKSSLLRAGLVPLMRERIAELGGPAVLRVLTPGERPASTYGHLLAPGPDEPESWVIVDQFEEVFTLCRDGNERERFLSSLLAARDPRTRLRVVIAVRADFHTLCPEEFTDVSLNLGPMTADELREAVVRPAQEAGLLVERELTARIVDDVVDRPGALPALSHALLETWRRRRGRMLTLAAYESVGGVRGAVAAGAEEVYGSLSGERAGCARRVLLRMVVPGGISDTSRPLTHAELRECADPDVPVVLEKLARARLVSVDEDGVRIAHEALIGSWPRLQGWIEEDRERLLQHRALTEAARTWREHAEDPGALYRGGRLARAEQLFPDLADDPALTASERAFLMASRDAREAERLAAARSGRRARTLAGALSAVLAVALVVGLFAFHQHRDNERQRTDAAARRLASVADGLRTTDPRTALLLGVAAWRIAPLPETRRALLGSLAQPERDAFTDPSVGYHGQRFLLDSGRTLLGAGGGRWRTWDLATRRRTSEGALPEGRVLAAGGRLVALGYGGGVRLWDLTARRWAGGRLPGGTVAFTASGREFVLGGQVRSAADGRVLFAASGDARVAADDRRAVVCPRGGSPQVWDIAAHREMYGAWRQAGAVCDGGAVSVSGNRVAVVTAGGVRVWDLGGGRQVAVVPDRAARRVLADGTFLVTAGTDEIRVWRLAAPGTPVFRYPLNNQSLAADPAWDPQLPFLRYLEGGTVHTLDLTTVRTTPWRTRPLPGVLLSPDGGTLALAEQASTGYRFELRATATGRLLHTLPAVPATESPAMAFSPDSGTFAYGGALHATVWDVRQARVRTELDLSATGCPYPVTGLALDDGGHVLFTVRSAGPDEPRNDVWDIAHHRHLGTVCGAHGDSRMGSRLLALRPGGGLIVGDAGAAELPSGKPDARDLVQGEETRALAFSADGGTLAAGDRTGRVALWDGQLRHRRGVLRNAFPAPLGGGVPEAVSALALSPDGRTLAVGGDTGTLQLWDTATRQPLGGALPTAGGGISTLAFSSDSGTLYVGGARVPLQRYGVDPGRVADRVCERAGGSGLSRGQWRVYVPEVGYRRVCRDR